MTVIGRWKNLPDHWPDGGDTVWVRRLGNDTTTFLAYFVAEFKTFRLPGTFDEIPWWIFSSWRANT